MKPDWDKLADELNSDHALIADVDCGKEVDVRMWHDWHD